MEWLLLLLLGSLAAGAVYWTGSSKPAAPPAAGSGPQSSPDLPERKERAPVIDVSPQDLAKVRDTLSRIPEPVKPTVISAPDGAKASAEKLKQDLKKKKKPLKVSYDTDQIIPRSSPHAFHRRPLQSAEQFVEEERAEEALNLYERVNKRIENQDINNKINSNIEDIRRWLEDLESDEDEPITLPEIIIPLSTQALALENLSEGLRKLTETLSNDIAKALVANQTPISFSSQSQSLSQTAPIIQQFYVNQAPVSLSGNEAAGVPAITMQPSQLPIGPSVATGAWDFFKHATDDFQFDEQGRLITDGRTDEDFEKEWQKYSQLPLTDRRSGDERRQPTDETDEFADRRSPSDRRNNDLFLERDNFLDSWKRHEERKQLLEDRGQSPLPPYHGQPIQFTEVPPQTEPIGLPDAGDHPLDKALEEASSIADQIQANVQTTEVRSEAHSESLSPLELPNPKPYKEPNLELTSPIPTASSHSTVEIVAEPLEAIELPAPEAYREPKAPTESSDVSEQPAAHEKPTQPDSKPEKDAKSEQPPPIDATASQADELGEGVEAAEFPDMPELPEEKGPVQEIRGVLELKPPDEDDAPFLTLTYDFAKIPDSFKLSRDYHTMEFVYYKYKPMLIKAQEFARRKMLKSALNYYRVIKSQNIPPEFRRMVNRNIQDITDYLEKFMMSRSGD
ncbi:MAG: hypothetical protein H3C43_03985 [Leptonema sp. (in: Bacteria)]|nr:hypothetical protein [Leptonema sp. (in: bacteria)]